jgi:two-component system alkaline phosphatase synthesis response regulator PhoP
MKILLVDDSRFLRTSNERTLQKAGYQVIAAADGEEGLRLALEQVPDLIVLDMMLPKISGPEVLRALRKNASTAAVPVMVLTSLPQSNREKLLNEGASIYFEKSVLNGDTGSRRFLEAIQNLLAKEKPHPAASHSR